MYFPPIWLWVETTHPECTGKETGDRFSRLVFTSPNLFVMFVMILHLFPPVPVMAMGGSHVLHTAMITPSQALPAPTWQGSRCDGGPTSTIEMS